MGAAPRYEGLRTRGGLASDGDEPQGPEPRAEPRAHGCGGRDGAERVGTRMERGAGGAGEPERVADPAAVGKRGRGDGDAALVGEQHVPDQRRGGVELRETSE